MPTNEDRAADRGLANLQPALLTIISAMGYSGKSRAGLYRGLARGDFVAVKDGGRTLIVTDSLRAHMSNLPTAKFRPAKAA